MCRKFVLGVVLLSLFAASSLADIKQSQDNIIALIKSSQFDSAKNSIDKLIADNSQSSELPQALYWIARNYGWVDKYEDEMNLYQMMMKNWPDDFWTNKAKLGNRRAEILSLISSEKFDDAKAAIDRLTPDFNSHPDLPDALYWIALRYGYGGKRDEEKNLYQQIIQNYPNSPICRDAKLGYGITEARLLIASQNFGKAIQVIEHLITDFNQQPQLSEMLYRIARGYQWSNNYREASSIYQWILQNDPNSSIYDNAKLGYATTKIQSLIVSQKSDEAQKSTDQLIADFNSNSQLPKALYEIAQRHGYSGNFEQEQNLYQQIIEDYPQSSFADKSKLDLAGAKVLDLVLINDVNDPNLSIVPPAEANIALEKFAADFNDNSYFSKAMLFMADKCHEAGVRQDKRKEVAGIPKWPRPFSFAADMLQKYVLNRPLIRDDKADAYRMVCEDYYRLGEGEKTSEYAALTLQTDPNHRFAANMLWLEATGYERMKAAGEIPAADGDSIIEDTYQELMDKFPQTYMSDWSATHLGMINYKAGNKFKACAYFCWFLMNASPDAINNQTRMEAIKVMTDGCGGSASLTTSGSLQGGK